MSKRLVFELSVLSLLLCMGGRGASGGGGGGGRGAPKTPYASPSLTGGKPALTGSEKQVAWANTLRDSYIAVMGKTHLQSVANTVAAHTQAKYWIDNRYGLGVTNAQQQAIQKLWYKK